MNLKSVELLAPAKNFQAIKAASNYADSVYFGISNKFNMRMRSENIPIEKLNYVVEFCHKMNKKAYLTTNILVYDTELKQLREVLEKSKQAGIDAVIVSDFATIQIAKEYNIPFHVSTQNNISNSISAGYYE